MATIDLAGAMAWLESHNAGRPAAERVLPAARLGVTIPEADHATVGSLDDLVADLARRSAEPPTGYDRRDDESADTR